MRKFTRFALILIPVLALSFQLTAQNNFFSSKREADIPAARGQRVIIPSAYKLAALDVSGMRNFLWSLPTEQKISNRTSLPAIITIPMPDGNNAKFRIWESAIMAPALAAQFPGIKTFAGQGIDDPTATIRLDWTARGFHAMILSSVTGNVFIDPFRQADLDNYTIYFKKDLPYNKNFFEHFIPGAEPVTGNDQQREMAGPCVGTALRTYRLALACTQEYATAVSLPSAPNATLAFSAMTTTMNRVNGVYEKELSVRMVFVPNNSSIIYLAEPDPYTNDNGQTMLGENTNTLNNVIGEDNYDIGHVFSTGGGGIATVGGPCGTSKARGVTGLPNPTGDAFDIDFVAHEMGHQFGASHTFNATTSNCGGSNRSASTAMEPGSGITIMGYAGICGSANNLAANSIATFHGISFDQISTFVSNPASGGGCPVVTPVTNNIPVVEAGSNFTIPRSTSFVLTGSATDADAADVLSYSWEQMDAGPAGNWDAPSGNAPLFRSFLPVSTPERNFPKLQDQINNTTTIGEILPSYGRTMNFRLTARDNHAGGGGVCFDEMQVTVEANSGPFVVSSPSSTGISWPANSSQTITWNVAGTNNAPVSCANVSILLSIDGGNTFPITILASTANDGTENITLPGNVTTTARIRVKSVGNIFYDISDNNFSITAATTGFGFNNPAAATVACAGPTSAAITLGVTSVAGFVNPVTLAASDLPVGTNVSFSTNPVIPGNSTTVTLNNVNLLANGTYNITVTGTSGALIVTKQLTYIVQTGLGPVINTHPQPQQACGGTNAVFTVVSPAGISYQWQISTNGGSSFTDITGATTATLTLPAVTTQQNNNQYRVIVKGQCSSTTSTAASLTVLTPPFVNTQPQSATLCVNSNANFTVVGGGSNPTYQWQVSTNGGASFTNIPAATGATLTINNITTAMNNNQYRVIVNGSCAPSDTSNAVTLTVVSPATVTTNPVDAIICESGTVNFSVNNSLPNLIFQWQVSTNGGTSYSNLFIDATYSGVTTSTLTITGVTAAMNNNRYRVLFSNIICPATTPSTGALLTVNARPTVTLSAPQVNILPGQSILITATILPVATGFDISWYKNDVLIPGVTGNTYLVDSVEVGAYKVKIVNQATGCNNESNELVIGASSSDRLFIFPNPNNGQFSLSYFNAAGTSTQQTVRVYDDHGMLVYAAKVSVTGPYTIFNVNLKQVARGVYLVVVGDAAGKRLAKEKIIIR